MMKDSKSIIAVLAILLCVSLSCTMLKDKLAGGEPANEFTRITKVPRLDPDGPFVSPGAVAVRKLAEVDPSVSGFIADIETAERGAMKKIAAVKTGDDAGRKKDKAASSSIREAETLPTTFFKSGSAARPQAALLMFQGGNVALPGMNDGVFVGMMAGVFKSMLSGAEVGNFNRKDSKTETTEGTSTTMEYELGGNADGSTVFGLGIKTESTKNGVKVTSEMQARIEGNDCPNAEGQVQLTVKMRMSARSGTAGYTQDVTIFIRILVDDNANISNTTIDLDQSTSRGKNGQEVFVQTGHTIKTGPGFDGAVQSNERVIQKTDNATATDVNEAWASGGGAAYGAAIGAIVLSENTWKGGKCIEIEARSPGSVDPGSGTEIAVKVRHKRETSDVVAKLEAVLVGEASIDPELIPKTPGTLMYVAPGETGKTATIKLKATSRRGIANLDLTASTGRNAYQIAGGLDEWYTNTIVCDITKPFTLTGTHGIKANFTGGLSGTYTYSGTSFSVQGSGTYEISFPRGRESAGEMIGRGPGTVKARGKTYGGSGTETYYLSPVDGPCVDGPVK
jgi:hypothetical protein